MAPGDMRAVLFFCVFALVNFSAGQLERRTYQDVQSVPVKIQLPSGPFIETSPGLKSGSYIVCERVRIPGLRRFEHLRKYAHSRRVKVQYSEGRSNTYSQKIELCIHRNASLEMGQCQKNEWKGLENGLWTGIMSPYETKFIDIRMPDAIFGSLTISVEEDFQPYRLVLLGLALVMLILAPIVSKWVPFYYSSAMAFGIIVIILIILFQAMKMLPTGRKSTLYIFLYGSVVGLGSVMLSYLSRLINSILQELGFGEEMFNPVAVFLLLVVVLTGAGLGFWGVRKLVLSEDGSVDTGTAQFVAWAIRIVACVMILQSSYDPLLAVLTLMVGLTSTLSLRHIQPTFWHFRKRDLLLRSKRHNRRQAKKSYINNSRAQFFSRTPAKDAEPSRSQGTPLKWSPYNPHIASSSLETPKSTPSSVSHTAGPSSVAPTATSSDSQIDEQDYYSTFHKTPERKCFSKEEWESFTKYSTRKALRELVSTYEFTKWARNNAERIMLSPLKNKEDTNHNENDSKVGIKQEPPSRGGGWFSW